MNTVLWILLSLAAIPTLAVLVFLAAKIARYGALCGERLFNEKFNPKGNKDDAETRPRT